MISSNRQELFMYIGCYTNKSNIGLHVCKFNQTSGEITGLERYADLPSPSYLALDRERQRLYAVSETMKYGDLEGGSVAAYLIHPDSGALTFLNRQPTHGGAPCHLSLDHTGSMLFAANYMGGNTVSYRAEEDGRLSEPLQLLKHHGSGPNRNRQEGPHAHAILPDPQNRFVLAADLGADRLFVYSLDVIRQTLTEKGSIQVEPGSGPRHFLFAPGGEFLYVIHELDSTISVSRYNSGDGSAEHVQTVSTLPEGFAGSSTCAEIRISPDGRFLYGSNRGHDSIAIYAVDETNGLLTFIEHVLTNGKTPRDFNITPNGQFLLSANQESDNIVVFRIDKETGRLQAASQTFEVSEPVCILWN